MLTEAISKLKAEMDGNKNNPYIKVIGDFLLRRLEADPGAAEKIMAADKTIAKSLDAMKTEAKKKQQNGMAILTDAEGFAIVLKYFGIKGAPVEPPAQVVPAPTQLDAPVTTSESAFDVKLDDFL